MQTSSQYCDCAGGSFLDVDAEPAKTAAVAAEAGYAQATNGPKTVIAISTPDTAAVTPMYGRPRIQHVTTATAA